jgi:hypothetical protein
MQNYKMFFQGACANTIVTTNFSKCLQAEMQTFVTKIVTLMKEEKLYSWQGGPIILQQVFILFSDAISPVS